MAEASCCLCPWCFMVKSQPIRKNEAQETFLQTQRGHKWVGFDGNPYRPPQHWIFSHKLVFFIKLSMPYLSSYNNHRKSSATFTKNANEEEKHWSIWNPLALLLLPLAVKPFLEEKRNPLYFYKSKFKSIQLFLDRKSHLFPPDACSLYWASMGSHTHTPVRVHTCRKIFPDKSLSSSLQTVGILMSWRFSAQKCLIRSFLTSSAAVCHALSTPLPERNRLAEHARKLPEHFPPLPKQKSELLTRYGKMPPF